MTSQEEKKDEMLILVEDDHLLHPRCLADEFPQLRFHAGALERQCLEGYTQYSCFQILKLEFLCS